MRYVLSFLALWATASTVAAQTDYRLCEQPRGYIEVYEQFVTGWADAKTKGTLVDPELTEIAVWVVQYENRMLAGESVRKLCLEMIIKRAVARF